MQLYDHQCALPNRGCPARTSPQYRSRRCPPCRHPSLCGNRSAQLHAQGRDGSIHTLSRIDRIFINLPMAELRNFQCHAHTVGSVGDRSEPSDLIPVRLTIVCTRVKQEDHPVTRRWLAQHPLFVSALHEAHQDMINYEDPSVALKQFKEVAFGASTKARQAILTKTSTPLVTSYLWRVLPCVRTEMV